MHEIATAPARRPKLGLANLRTLMLALLATVVAPSVAASSIVSGHVTDSSALGIADVGMSFGAGLVAITDANGAYSLPNVPDGTYDVHVSPPEDSGFLPQTVPGVSVNGDTTFNVVLVSAEPVQFDGVLRDSELNPIAGQRVLVLQGGTEITNVVTDVDGSFALEVAPGTYNVRVNSASAQPNAPNGGWTYNVAALLDLSADRTEDVIVPTRRLSGTVRDPDGNPVINATVGNTQTCFGFGNVDGSGIICGFSTTTVTPDGAYHLVLLPFTNLTVRVVPQPGEGTPTTFQADLSAGDVVHDVDLPNPVQFDGVLRDSELNPIAGQRVLVLQGGTEITNVVTDVDGSFALEVAPGTYNVRVNSASAQPNAPNGGWTYNVAAPLDLSADRTEDVIVPTRRLSGTVRDPDGNPVINATVGNTQTCFGFGNVDGSGIICGFSTTTVTPDGAYHLVLLPFTNLTVRVVPQPGEGTPTTFQADLSAGDVVHDVDLPNPVQFDGVLRDSELNPIAGQRVLVLQGGTEITNVVTDVDGSFALEVAPGTYNVRVNSASAQPNAPNGGWTYNVAALLDLSADRTEDVIVPTRRLSGTVRDPDGNPVINATVGNTQTCFGFGNVDGSGIICGFSTTTVAPDGRFNLVLLPFTNLTVRVTPAQDSGFVSFLISHVDLTTDAQFGILLQFRTDGGEPADVPAGGTTGTDPEDDGATFSDPIETEVTTPQGGGTRNVTVTEVPISVEEPAEYRFLTQQVDIEVSPATAPSISDPFILRFVLDSSRIPAGETARTVQMFRNGALVQDCGCIPTVDTNDAFACPDPKTASPNPCVWRRQILDDSVHAEDLGDLEIVVLTTRASSWNFGTERPPADLDGDGVPDADDNCPNANPDQSDRDADGVGDACDGCPDDVTKTALGACGCGVADIDGDMDGVANCIDNCPSTANADQSDADDDGVGDACDGCPQDPTLSNPNVCGCGVAETDDDVDGTIDCVDNCPSTTNTDQADGDGDGAGDACDQCPDDATSTTPGACGCGVAETDTDGDTIADCVDNCPTASNTDQHDSNGNGVGDACEPCGVNGAGDTIHLRAMINEEDHGSGGDLLIIRGQSNTQVPLTSLMTTEPTVRLTNGSGLAFEESVLRSEGRLGRYRFVVIDRNAKQRRQGIAKLLVTVRPNGGIGVRVRAYGDLGHASTDMVLELRLGAHCFSHASDWRETTRGWVLRPD